MSHHLNTTDADLVLGPNEKGETRWFWEMTQFLAPICLERKAGPVFNIAVMKDSKELADYASCFIDNTDVTIHTLPGRALYLTALDRANTDEDHDEPAAPF